MGVVVRLDFSTKQLDANGATLGRFLPTSAAAGAIELGRSRFTYAIEPRKYGELITILDGGKAVAVREYDFHEGIFTLSVGEAVFDLHDRILYCATGPAGSVAFDSRALTMQFNALVPAESIGLFAALVALDTMWANLVGFTRAPKAEGHIRLIATIVDITTLEVDAIVNAANSALTPGGGVCGAIHRAAGPELALACARLGPCPTGEARLTPGFRLPARFVIHAVGPVWRGGQAGEPELLASAYRSSLRVAGAEQFRSIAFPAISTGIYGYPLREATQVAVAAVRRELAQPSSITDVVFACFNPEVRAAYAAEGISA